MRCATHALSLQSIFEGRAHPLTAPVVMGAKIGVTAEVIADYIKILGGNPLFQAWFSAAQAENRLLVKSKSDAPGKFSLIQGHSACYGVASYFSGGHLFSDAHASQQLNVSALKKLGIEILDINSAPPKNIPGDNPVYTLSLINSGTENPSILDRFIQPEDVIVVYDKYINEAGLQLIEHISKILSDGSCLHIRTTDIDARCKKIPEISARVGSANPKIQVSCENVSIPFRQNTHDRYIFFGSRLQAVFTAGLDCFGAKLAAGTRKNKQSKVNIYAVDPNSSLHIESSNGSVLSVNCVEPHVC